MVGEARAHILLLARVEKESNLMLTYYDALLKAVSNIPDNFDPDP